MLRTRSFLPPLPLRHARHAPAIDGGALKRAEHKALGREADEADGDDRSEHHVGVEKLLGVEDHPARAPIGCSQHFGADHRDPRAQERLPQPRDDEGRGARNDHPLNDVCRDSGTRQQHIA